MATQNYANHRHPPKTTGVGFLCLLLGIVGFGLRWFEIGGHYAMALGVSGLIAAVLVLLFISRSYVTALQDRIIKLEMRVRCATLLSPAQQAVMARLTKPQIVALRFASDQELPALLERADREKLAGEDIKKAIQNWVPDLDRT